ncbi:hypothetical protein HMPREF9064_1781 [Aggregatibacter segnis ATCC 33393]|uniref:Uncharacterized protein n=1 Tax=Aggregatibacter segnis ATCC 33393 TaxID=888057 RepID=E6L049_9PAST|nr:hypothetical protein HMPREF9064_1781 [Aggregatibacter segnis ATCC 33393]
MADYNVKTLKFLTALCFLNIMPRLIRNQLGTTKYAIFTRPN